jgi:hypothetical protein
MRGEEEKSELGSDELSDWKGLRAMCWSKQFPGDVAAKWRGGKTIREMTSKMSIVEARPHFQHYHFQH